MSPESVKSMAQKRVRRQKIFIAVGSVVLLAVLGFELPKVLGGGGGAAAPAVTTVAPNAVGALVVPAGKLPNTDRVVVVRDSNQLISFGLFKSKDPFVQQLSVTASTPAPAPAPVPAPPPPTSTSPSASTTVTGASAVVPAPAPAPAGAPAPAPVPPPATTTPAAPAPVTTDALIATNGVCERIPVAGTFPGNENIFRLVSIAPNGKSVKIGVVGGSFDSGQPTATLKLGQKFTLVNTADGTRYVIELKSSCSTVVTPGSATSAQPVPTTPVAAPSATTATTTTMPIVTDFLDTTVPTG